jgi:two-component system cell cycle response regulator
MASLTAAGDDASQTFRTPKQEPLRRANHTACLVYIYPTGPKMGSRYTLSDEPVFIGRQEDCAIRNTDESVSRYHARIAHGDDGSYTVTDLGSTNGTFVNNQRRQTEVLHDGDYVRIGNCIYRYLTGGNIEAEYHEEIYRLTVIDGLTQVHNRRYLVEFLEREIARSQRHGRPLSLVMFDIDRFKGINDLHGHLAGDVTLRDLCGRVKAVVRQDELLARYGGEEFAVVLPEADPVNARALAERIREVTAQHPFTFNDVQFPVTVSLGVATTSSEEELGVNELVSRADANLYKAKLAGRNCVVS